MSVTLIARAVEKPSRRGRVITVEPTFADNYATPGQALDFTAITNPGGLPAVFPGECPQEVRVYNTPLAYRARIVPGVALNDWRIAFLDEATGAELADGAYPAGITDKDVDMRLDIITRW